MAGVSMTELRAKSQKHLGLLFDLDGVLWDSSRLHEQAFFEIGNRHGLRPVHYDELAGRPTSAAWRMVLEANQRPFDSELVTEMTSEKQELAREWLRADPPLSAEIGYLSALPPELALGLVTGASAQTTSIFLDAAGITFDAVVTGDSVTTGKPSPEPYEVAASQLRLRGSDCWVLEDSEQGLESAVLAGMHCAHLTPEGPLSAGQQQHPMVEGCVSTIRDFILMIDGVLR